MHVVLLPHRFLPARGGVQTVFARTARALTALGHRATVLTSTATSTGSMGWPTEDVLPEGVAVEDGVHVLRLPIHHPGRRVRTLLHRAKELIGDANGSARDVLRRRLLGPDLPGLDSALRELAPDLVVASGMPYRHVFDGRRAAARLGIPFALMPCIHVHRPEDHATPSARRLYRDADHLLPLTTFEAELLVQWGAEPRRVHVLPLGPDLPDAGAAWSRTQCRERYGVPGDAPYVLCLGRLSPQKHVPLLLDAFELVAPHAHDLRLVLAGGSTSWSRDALPEDLARRRLGGRAEVVSDFPSAAKRALIEGAQVLVNPSHEESFGIVFLEALACGVPVVGADIGPIRSALDGRAGARLFEPRSVRSLADAIGSALGEDQRPEPALSGDGWSGAARLLTSLVA